MAEKRFNCEKAVELIYEYLDGELNGEELVRFEKHISECAECSKELEERRRFLCMLKSEGKLTPTRDVFNSVMSDPAVVKLSEERRNADADAPAENIGETSKVLRSESKVSRFTRLTKYLVPAAAAAVIVVAVAKSPYFFNTEKYTDTEKSLQKAADEAAYMKSAPGCDNAEIDTFSCYSYDATAAETGSESSEASEEMLENNMLMYNLCLTPPEWVEKAESIEAEDDANDSLTIAGNAANRVPDSASTDSGEMPAPLTVAPTSETGAMNEAETTGLGTGKDTITEICGLPKYSMPIENGKIDSEYTEYYDNAGLFLMFSKTPAGYDFVETAKFENSDYTIYVYDYSDELAEKIKKSAENSGENYISEEYPEKEMYLIVYIKKAS